MLISGCGGGGGGGGDSISTTPAPVVSLSASSISVLLNETSTLTWSSTNASSCSASGSWSGTKTTSGSEAVTISTAGNNSFTLSCSGAGGTGSASVTVEGYRNSNGVVVDGYISGAEVFIDEDGDWILDSNENSTTSDNDGKFTLKYSNGNLVSIGGTDLDSQNLLDNFLITQKLSGHTEFKAITPVTSIAAFMNEPSDINAALGIDPAIDVSIFDPVANKGDGGVNDYLYEKGNQLTVIAYALQNIANNLNTTTETTQDYFQSMAEVIDAEYAETESRVNIETEAFITKALDSVISKKTLTLDNTNKTNTISALTSIIPVIQVKANDANTVAIFNFATSTFQSDAQAMASGSATSEVISSYQTDILNYVATDQSLVASELEPDITAIIDSVTIDEDITIDINVLNNDSYLTTASISVGIDNPSDGTASVSNNIVTYVPDDNFFGTDSISYTISQNEKISSSNISIVINSVNDVPIFDNLLSTYRVDENQTAVTSISASDVEKEALTISLAGTDQSSFNLSSENVLTFNESPDYETKTSYELIISVTDGIDTLDKNVSVNLNNLNDNLPVFTSDSTFSSDENQTSIGTVLVADADGDSIAYSISGSEIVIDGASGLISFALAPDYETTTSFAATVTATDGPTSITQDITVDINNLNDNSPAFSSGATFSADENQSAIGTVASSDADGDDVTYSINGSEIVINSSSGVISFVADPDYETKTSYTATVTSSDGTNSTTQDITVNINNLNDNSPVFTSDPTFSAAENQTAISTVTATDADGSSLSFSVSGSELSITSAGVLTFATAPDYETKASYTATVTVNDGANTTTQDITVNVADINEAPVFTSNETFSADENQTAIGTATGSDQDGNSLSFTVSGSELAITSAGVLTFASAPDYETKSSYTATVSMSDSIVTTTQNITVNVSDINDAPVATAASYAINLLPQSQTSKTLTLAGTDQDGNTLTYAIASNGTHGTASLSGSTITYQTAANTQSAQSDSFTFTANDGTVDSSAATISLDLRTDPLYQYQWHLNNTGQTNFATNAGTAGADLNVDTAIVSGITGNGIVVAVVDDGIEIAHEDLASNIISGSYDFVNSDSDPTQPDPCEDDDDCGGHGTSVAGIIAAEGWNNKGVRGVAPNASLIGYNVIGTGASASPGQYWGTSPPVSVDVDVYNNSFGVAYVDDETTYDLSTYLSGTTLAVLENGVNNLRGGKGAIYVFSAGNNFSRHATSSCGTNLACQEGIVDNQKNQPYTIPVASLNASGVKASYSTPGANIWVSGFGGEYGWDGSIFSGNDGYPAIMTVDRSTCSLGYSRTGGNSNYGKNKFNLAGQSFSDQLNLNPDCNYNSHFNGTSAAAPTVSGVVALMLEANPNLTWRDVKHILATTADKIDASKSFDQQGLNQYSWIENQAGYEHHKWYGFGKIDAAEAVSTAKTYTANSRGTFSTVSAQGVPNSAINDDGTTLTNEVTVTKTEGSNNFVEYVKVHVKFNHAVPKSIGIRLQSPDGTVYPIMQPYTNISTDSSGTQFDIGIAGFYGESVEGNWTIALNDYIGDSNSGTFVGWNIYISGN